MRPAPRAGGRRIVIYYLSEADTYTVERCKSSGSGGTDRRLNLKIPALGPAGLGPAAGSRCSLMRSPSSETLEAARGPGRAHGEPPTGRADSPTGRAGSPAGATVLRRRWQERWRRRSAEVLCALPSRPVPSRPVPRRPAPSVLLWAIELEWENSHSHSRSLDLSR